jgi:NAD(P)-dependent dehydrogenase (short-subunit alcohol dehydrogenase family)
VQAVADAIVAAGGEALAHTCNAGDLEQIESLMRIVKDECGRLDILINNAAANPYYGPASDLPPDAFDKTVAVNLKGPYYFMSHAVPLMIESGGGAIVNVASIAALLSMPGQAVYSMTKAGLISITKAFAREYGQGGPVARAGQPADMVAGVLYLVSDEAAYTTGTTLVMDGGATLG